MEYIIVGDTEKYKECLIYVCGKNKEVAENALERIINNPNDNDLKLIKGHSNFKIKTVEDKDCWWKQGGLD